MSYSLIIPIMATCLVAGFLFMADVSLPSKISVVSLLVLTFLLSGHSMALDLAATLSQAALGIGLLIYFKVAR
ncbi:MAG: hypothetical protein ACREPU_03305 [Rhodanobacteraceae bacterium]